MLSKQEILDYAGGDEEFANWLEQVNRLVEAVAGLSIFDLGDQPYRDWYDYLSPAKAARAALVNNGYPID